MFFFFVFAVLLRHTVGKSSRSEEGLGKVEVRAIDLLY